MKEFLISKILHTIIVAFCVLTLVFVVLHMTGDPVLMLLPPDPSQEEIEALTRTLGLDQPLHIQYWRFFIKVIQGDFGDSFQHQQPAMKLVMERLPASLLLTVTGVILAVVIALPLGILAAIRRGSIIDNIAVAFAAVGQSAPFFWIGLMLILIFAVKLHLLPTTGYGSWKQLVMPAITLATYPMAAIARLVRSSMLEVLGMDYIKTARSKGLREAPVILKHALKNASIPVVTMVGLQFGMLLGGSIVCEMIFAWPGVGRLIIFALYNRDYPLVEAAVFVVAMVFVLCNLLVDLSYAFLDPRVRIKP
ncbi:MAG: ABC transporter permease [Deltaproteobacteria bacterium]|nr:ABC transporter permease [Deltaproteobacteria bacterium]MBW2308882.1 ABC transporter permease [Deltaproteobacteria bacterium]